MGLSAQDDFRAASLTAFLQADTLRALLAIRGLDVHLR